MIAPRCALLGALVTAAACAPRGAPGPGFLVPPPRSIAPPSACDVPGDAAAAPDTLSVAVPGAVDPAHAPVPVTGGERVLFRQLYETLLRLDCEGRLHPALAAVWSTPDGGRTWTLTIADSARFWDGVPVGARDVIAAWGTAISAVAESTAATGDHTLTVRLRRPAPEGPVAIADPALAVAKRVPGIAWPIGTGAYWVSGVTADLTAAPVGGARRPVLRWRPAGGDQRDLLDAGVDLLVTDDPGAVAYAATRADFSSVPLPWDRTYVLLAPVPVRAPAPILEDLARHAVRVEARPASPPFWWQDSTCGAGPPPGTASIVRSGSAIVFVQGDAVARDLADRLVALSLDAQPRRAVGVLPEALAGRLAARGDDWFVVSVPRTALDACAAWSPGLWGSGITPLLDVRRRMLVRHGGARLSIDWDAVPRIR